MSTSSKTSSSDTSPASTVASLRPVSSTSPAPSDAPASPRLTPVPVFAPRPLRIPMGTFFSQRTLLVLHEDSSSLSSQQARTPSPVTSGRSNLGSPASLSGVIHKTHHRSRSSSLASGEWSFTGEVVKDAAPASSLHVSPSYESDGEQLMRLYSPSHDGLDDFLKLVNPSGTSRIRNSPLSFREVFNPTSHKRQWSDASSTKEGADFGRTSVGSRDGESTGGRLPIPASPVSRQLTRNPIIYNPQFVHVQEES